MCRRKKNKMKMKTVCTFPCPLFCVYNGHFHLGEVSFYQPGESLGADPVNGAGEKTVGNRCISRLEKYRKGSVEKYRKGSVEKYHKINQKSEIERIASMPQVDSLISPVVAHGVNTISAPFRPDIDQLKMSQVQPEC